MVVHCAATLKLEGSLKQALHLNTRGTQRALEVAKTLPHLKVRTRAALSTGAASHGSVVKPKTPPLGLAGVRAHLHGFLQLRL